MRGGGADNETVAISRAPRTAEAQHAGHLCSCLKACRCICGGDEMGRTQRGNNNAYCQDNEISWFDWKLNQTGSAGADGLHKKPYSAATAPSRCSGVGDFFRAAASAGRRSRIFPGFDPDGKEMTDDDWAQGYVRCLGVRLAGDAIEEKDSYGNQIWTKRFSCCSMRIMSRCHWFFRPINVGSAGNWFLIRERVCRAELVVSTSRAEKRTISSTGRWLS